MTPENRQRLVGIVVLVAFVALLIPFLFTSGVKKKQAVSDEIPINAEKRQLIDQQIQSIDTNQNASSSNIVLPPPATPVEQQPAVPPIPQVPGALPQSQVEQPNLLPPESSQGEVIKADANQAQVAPPPATTTANAIPPVPEATNVSNEQLPSVDTSSAVTESAVASETTKVPKLIKATLQNNDVKKPAKDKKAKNKKAKLIKAKGKTVRITKGDAKGFWAVQVGSFSDQARIQKLVAQLHQKGFRVYMQKITTTQSALTRIMVGHEASKEKAEVLAKKIETIMKIKGRVVRNK